MRVIHSTRQVFVASSDDALAITFATERLARHRKVNGITLIGTLILVVLLAACGKSTNENRSAVVMTAAAETAQARLIINTTHLPGESPTSTAEPSASPTPTILINATFGPSPVVSLTPIPTSPGCDVAAFITDITIEDGAEISAGTPFIKIWELRNDGSCTWTTEYQVISFDWQVFGGPDKQPLTNAPVPPGSKIQVSFDLIAPQEPGRYIGYFLLRNAAGENFGIGLARKPFYVEIVVVPNTGTSTATVAVTSTISNPTTTMTPTPSPTTVTPPTNTSTPSVTPGTPYP